MLNHCQVRTPSSIQQRLIAGVIGGLLGGVVFGTMMWQMGMLAMIAGMMGSQSLVVGWGIHLMISAIFGLLAGLIVKFMPTCPGQMLLFAGVFGIVLWVIGPLLAMPLMTGAPLFSINEQSQASLMGHIVYAFITLLIAHLISTRLARKSPHLSQYSDADNTRLPATGSDTLHTNA